ncbi:hypothetical protein FEZ32_11435 [Acidipropionibacterium jensenii]|uniref:hypothetical protein n=1 Tax=Acidipropionibacterium jensenii TaxID=1749 RepID=UPI00110A2B01|nr:hypothetical protein [Acidipropionibacterium jensenii]QCV88880.1 hypothetical protein FEZ32_11435 [Acidipropionibacterium jensenii]
MAPPAADRWIASSWFRQEWRDDPPVPLRPGQAAQIIEELDKAGVRDADMVEVPAGLLRQLVALAEGGRRVPGARIEDAEMNAAYLVTISPREQSARLRTVEVVPLDPSRPVDPRAFRIPEQSLADAAAVVLARQRAAVRIGDPNDPDQIARVVSSPQSARPASRSRPDAEQLREDVREGLPIEAMAERYSRSKSTILQWLRKARRERPDLNWPAVRHPGVKHQFVARTELPGEDPHQTPDGSTK